MGPTSRAFSKSGTIKSRARRQDFDSSSTEKDPWEVLPSTLLDLPPSTGSSASGAITAAEHPAAAADALGMCLPGRPLASPPSTPAATLNLGFTGTLQSAVGSQSVPGKLKVGLGSQAEPYGGPSSLGVPTQEPHKPKKVSLAVPLATFSSGSSESCSGSGGHFLEPVTAAAPPAANDPVTAGCRLGYSAAAVACGVGAGGASADGASGGTIAAATALAAGGVGASYGAGVAGVGAALSAAITTLVGQSQGPSGSTGMLSPCPKAFFHSTEGGSHGLPVIAGDSSRSSSSSSSDRGGYLGSHEPLRAATSVAITGAAIGAAAAGGLAVRGAAAAGGAAGCAAESAVGMGMHAIPPNLRSLLTAAAGGAHSSASQLLTSQGGIIHISTNPSSPSYRRGHSNDTVGSSWFGGRSGKGGQKRTNAGSKGGAEATTDDVIVIPSQNLLVLNPANGQSAAGASTGMGKWQPPYAGAGAFTSGHPGNYGMARGNVTNSGGFLVQKPLTTLLSTTPGAVGGGGAVSSGMFQQGMPAAGAVIGQRAQSCLGPSSEAAVAAAAAALTAGSESDILWKLGSAGASGGIGQEYQAGVPGSGQMLVLGPVTQQREQQQQQLMQLLPVAGSEGSGAGSLNTVMVDALKLVKELQEKARRKKVRSLTNWSVMTCFICHNMLTVHGG